MSRPSRFPHTLVLIFALVVLAQLATYLLPPGEYTEEPKPSGGDSYVSPAGLAPLGDRLARARADRGVEREALAAMFAVAPDTVARWEAGMYVDNRQTRHVEARVGALLENWIATGEPPAPAAIAGWKTAAKAANIRSQLVPGSYRRAAERPSLPYYTAFTAVPRGLEAAADIIFFVFLIGGVIGIMRATGAFDALIGAALNAFRGRPFLLIGGSISLFAAGSGLIGMAEEYVPFIPLLVTMALALRLDAMVGIAIVFVGYAVGYGAAPFNPFTVLVAQDIAGLQPSSGWEFRLILLLSCLVVGIHHVLRYARRVRKDPTKSLVADLDYSEGFEAPEGVPLTPRRIAILVSFLLAIGIVVYGVKTNPDVWHFGTLSALFLGLGVVAALFGGMSPNAAARTFCAGAAELTTTALLIGFARAIQVVLDDGAVLATVVNSIGTTLSGLGAEVGAIGMLIVQTICNFFVPSGSGQAYVTMPIMAPLADELGLQRQVAVLAYQMGDGFTNVITPTNAAFMGMLAMARVPYQRWLRFALPLMLKLYLIGALGLVVAVWIDYR